MSGRGGRGGRGGRNNRGGRGGRGHGSYFSSNGKGKQKGQCAEHIFDFQQKGSADLLRTTWDKIDQYVRTKYSQDMASELVNLKPVVIPDPEYPQAALDRHDVTVKRKLKDMNRKLKAYKTLKEKLEPLVESDPKKIVEIAEAESAIEKIEYELTQDFPVEMTASEEAAFNAEWKNHRERTAAIKKHRGNVFSLVKGQCTEVLLERLKREEKWSEVSESYGPIKLYKLITLVVQTKTDELYPHEQVYNEFLRVLSFGEADMTNYQYFERQKTKVEVAEGVGVSFVIDSLVDYQVEKDHPGSTLDQLSDKEQEKVKEDARERFLAYTMLRNADNKRHSNLKETIQNDFIKNLGDYPATRQEVMYLMDNFSKQKASKAS